MCGPSLLHITEESHTEDGDGSGGPVNRLKLAGIGIISASSRYGARRAAGLRGCTDAAPAAGSHSNQDGIAETTGDSGGTVAHVEQVGCTAHLSVVHPTWDDT